MKLTARHVTTGLAAAAVFAFSGSAMATNGYFTHGVGTQSKGMAGTGVGSNADMGPIMSVSNPALGVFKSAAQLRSVFDQPAVPGRADRPRPLQPRTWRVHQSDGSGIQPGRLYAITHDQHGQDRQR